MVALICPYCKKNNIRRSKRTLGNNNTHAHYKCKDCGDYFWDENRRVLTFNSLFSIKFAVLCSLYFCFWLLWFKR